MYTYICIVFLFNERIPNEKDKIPVFKQTLWTIEYGIIDISLFTHIHYYAEIKKY